MRFSLLTLAALPALVLPALVRGDSAPTTGPTTIDLSGNSPQVTAADAGDIVREGTHVVGRTGRLNHSADGQQAIMVFDSDPAAGKSPAMIVLPNLNLFSMESVTASKTTAVDFRISGTVTEYKGRNYILVDSAQTTLLPAVVIVPVAVAHPKPKPEFPPQEAAFPPPTQPAAVGVMGLAASRKMDQLLAPLPGQGRELPVTFDPAPPTNVTTGKAAVAPDAPVLKVIREGTHLINRSGRLNHSPDGAQAILTFDTDGKTLGDPPMVILPNLKLSAMEGVVLGLAGDLHFRISGTITEYKGRNYILLDKAVSMADVETQF